MRMSLRKFLRSGHKTVTEPIEVYRGLDVAFVVTPPAGADAGSGASRVPPATPGPVQRVSTDAYRAIARRPKA